MDNQKTVWLLKEGEPLPIVQGAKWGRTGLLADYLSTNGHNVVWWSSTFIHAEKKYLHDKYTEINVKSNYKLELLHSDIAYMKNTSVKRMFYCNRLAKQFREKSVKFEKPDIIICSYPTMSFSREAVRYGKKHHVPVIIDARDRWPDIFERAFPSVVRPFANFLLWPLKRQAHQIFKSADAITGVQPNSLKWALNYAGHEQRLFDRAIYIGCKKISISTQSLTDNLDNWLKLGISSDTWNLCIFTSLSSSSLDIDTVIHAVDRLHKKHPDIRFVIGGLGDAYDRLAELTKDMESVLLAGWLNQDQMSSLMSISKCGIFCYRNTQDFRNALGNKAIQYMSGKLPILTSTEGFAKKYLATYDMGLAYKEGNVDDCAEKIETLYKHPEMVERMSANSYNRFLIDFESDVVNEQFSKLIDSIIGQGN